MSDVPKPPRGFTQRFLLFPLLACGSHEVAAFFSEVNALDSSSSLFLQNLASEYLHFLSSTYRNTQEFTLVKKKKKIASILLPPQASLLFFSFPSLSKLLKAQFALTVGASFLPTPNELLALATPPVLLC